MGSVVVFLCERLPWRLGCCTSEEGVLRVGVSGCDSLPAPPAMRRVLAYARAYPAISPHIPCAAARSCPCRAATPRGRGSFRGSSDTNVVHTRIAGGATAQRAVANRLHAYCAPATPEASARHAHPIYAADARPTACALADPKQRGRGGCAAVSLVLGLKLRALRVGAALL